MTDDTNITPLCISGAYWTGASAVVDLLTEHTDCAVVPGEFSLFSFGQFFQEVFTPLANGDFPEKALVAHRSRMCDFDRSDLYPFRAVGRRIGRKLGWYPELFFGQRTGAGKTLGPDYRASRKVLDLMLADISAAPDQFCEADLSASVKTVLDQAGRSVAASSGRPAPRYAVFDQLVAPPYFEDARRALPTMKYIVVDRDWRDQYISMRPLIKSMMERNRALGVRPWDEDDEPIQDDVVEVFLKFRKKVANHLAARQEDSSYNILQVQYEELVMDNETTTKRIFDFLDLSLLDWCPLTVFFSERSKLRIGKWKRHPWCDSDLERDIDRLKEQLSLPRISFL
ncbi:MAG: sulfotransferase [Alphaproteobacteria bacterium]|nr:sulfotransferase [Alphaproteobacteria bacterium]